MFALLIIKHFFTCTTQKSDMHELRFLRVAAAGRDVVAYGHDPVPCCTHQSTNYYIILLSLCFLSMILCLPLILCKLTLESHQQL